MWWNLIISESLAMMHTVYLGLGSNQGNKDGNLRQSLHALERSQTVTITAISKFYCSAPVGYLQQDWFLNAVVQARTDLRPLSLLQKLKMLEFEGGREKTRIRFGPRPIDLDLLLYDQQVIDTPVLILPHPRMHKRRFVLKPFCDINPEVIHPILKVTVEELLSRIDDSDQVVLPVEYLEENDAFSFCSVGGDKAMSQKKKE
jgi:2-amino-4-hydroxy-6-hydroxymethyldihydropteridine diphosphokinase